MFGDIVLNVLRHSQEYNFPPIPRVPRIPLHVPVFLVLYTTKNYIKMFLSHRKGTAKATAKITKIVHKMLKENIYSACNPLQVVVFCKHVLIL